MSSSSTSSTSSFSSRYAGVDLEKPLGSSGSSQDWKHHHGKGKRRVPQETAVVDDANRKRVQREESQDASAIQTQKDEERPPKRKLNLAGKGFKITIQGKPAPQLTPGEFDPLPSETPL